MKWSNPVQLVCTFKVYISHGYQPVKPVILQAAAKFLPFSLLIRLKQNKTPVHLERRDKYISS